MAKHSKSKSKSKYVPGFWFGLNQIPTDPLVATLGLELCRRGWILRNQSFVVSVRQLSRFLGCSQSKIRNAFKVLTTEKLCTFSEEHQKEHFQEHQKEHPCGGKNIICTLSYTLSGWKEGAPKGAVEGAPKGACSNIDINTLNKDINNNNIIFRSFDSEVEQNPASEPEPNQPEQSAPTSQAEGDSPTEEPAVKQSSKPKPTVRITKGTARRIAEKFSPFDVDDGLEQLRYLIDHINLYWTPKLIAIRNNQGDEFWEKQFIRMDYQKREKGLLWGVGDDGIAGYYPAYQVAKRKNEMLMGTLKAKGIIAE